MTEITQLNGPAQVITLRTPSTAKGPDNPPANSIDRSAVDVGNVETSIAVQTVSKDQKADEQETKSPFDRAAEEISKLMPDQSNTRLRINKDDETGGYFYENVDNDTGKVIQRFPAETIMEMLASYRDVEGIAVDSKA